MPEPSPIAQAKASTVRSTSMQSPGLNGARTSLAAVGGPLRRLRAAYSVSILVSHPAPDAHLQRTLSASFSSLKALFVPMPQFRPRAAQVSFETSKLLSVGQWLARVHTNLLATGGQNCQTRPNQSRRTWPPLPPCGELASARSRSVYRHWAKSQPLELIPASHLLVGDDFDATLLGDMFAVARARCRW